jgi:hypothetical protein
MARTGLKSTPPRRWRGSVFTFAGGFNKDARICPCQKSVEAWEYGLRSDLLCTAASANKVEATNAWVTQPVAAMPDTVMRWMAAAAFIAALPADAADLSPPSPPCHRPHGLLGHVPRAPSDVPVVAPQRDLPKSQAGEHAGNPVLDWGANSTFVGPSVTTDPSGVIGRTLPSSNHELSPNWHVVRKDDAAQHS